MSINLRCSHCRKSSPLKSIKCACGNEIQTKSTSKNIEVEICSACHPFYTGKQKLVDTAGRIERFNKKYGVKSAE